VILVTRIDFGTGMAELVEASRTEPSGPGELQRVTQLALSLGLRPVVRHETPVAPVPTGGTEPSPAGAADSPATRRAVGGVRRSSPVPVKLSRPTRSFLLQHRWTLAPDLPVYDGSFLHEAGCLPQLSRYAALLLSTYGVQTTHLMQLRLALYEICANVVEHGLRSRRHGRIELRLDFRADGIEGWVSDSCERFDPSEVLVSPLPVSVAARKPRGYGIRIIRQLLDDLGHEYEDTGNRITFRKRIRR
jgi:anti-sigma regulatory factor (Ser/Thr protein kinase)